MTMTKTDPEREERRRQQQEIAESLKASGALDLNVTRFLGHLITRETV